MEFGVLCYKMKIIYCLIEQEKKVIQSKLQNVIKLH